MATPQRFLSLSRIGNATAENLTVLPSSVRALAHRAAVFCALILPMWPTGRLHHWGLSLWLCIDGVVISRRATLSAGVSWVSRYGER